jgi:hypothetical protein
MKLSHFAPLAIAASAAIGLAPIASAADVIVQQRAGNGVQQSPGNIQVTATPGAAAQQAAQQQLPFGGNVGALLFHN